MKKPDNLIFLHIPKTAGTTLHTILGRNYPERKCCTVNAIRWPEKLENLDGKTKNNISLLKGHVPYGAHTYMKGGSFEYFTLLREPIDRTISHYYQVLRTKEHHFAAEMAERKYSLKELMESGRLLFMDNLQTRMISGDLRVPYGEVNEKTFEKAIRNLEQHFPVVGIQKYFDEFVMQLALRYDWKFKWYRRQQIAGKRPKVQDLDGPTLVAVKRYNEWDEKLFRFVEARHKVKMEELGPQFHEKVQQFKKRNERIGAIIKMIPFFPKVRGD